MNFSWRSSWKYFNYIFSNYKPKYKYNGINKYFVFKNTILSFSVLNCAATEDVKLTDVPQNTTNENLTILEHVKNLESRTFNLIQSLHKGLLEKGEMYRQCLERQIYIISKGFTISQNNTQIWDELLENKFQAENLKKQIDAYHDLIQYVGRTMENVILMSAVLETEVKEVFAYYELKSLADSEEKANKMMEAQLLRATMKNIVGPKTSKNAEFL